MISTELHCDSSGIMTKKGIPAQIGIFGLLTRKIAARNKAHVYIYGIPIGAESRKSPMVSTSSYDGEIQASFNGSGATIFLKSLLSDLLFEKEGIYRYLRDRR